MNASDLHRLSPASRRQFLLGAASSLLGVSTAPLSSGAALPETEIPARTTPAKRIISLYMGGGMTQLETFSPRPEASAEIRGNGSAIATSADGIQISQFMPRTAKFMHHAVAFRALNSNQGAHAEGSYFMKTNWRKRGTIQHPHLGAWTSRLAGSINPELPGFVSIMSGAKLAGAGFLGPEHEQLIVRDSEKGLANATLAKGDTADAMKHRLSLTEKLNAEYQTRYASGGVQAYGAAFEATTKLMQSSDLDAFDISRESAKRRALYGNSRFGQGCLLARRLSASGVRFVEVNMGGWDTHTDHFERAPGLLSNLDRGLSALLEDLAATGELDETLITVSSEFGRTPQLNRDKGRDHYPQAFSGLIAGGRIQGGQVHGEVDANGIEITADKTDVTTFNATVAWALGLPVREIVYSPSKRPFTVANGATPLTHLFAS